MTCGLGTAAHSLHARQRATEIKKSFRSIMWKSGTGAEVGAMTVEQGKCSVFWRGRTGENLPGACRRVACPDTPGSPAAFVLPARFVVLKMFFRYHGLYEPVK